MAKTEQNPRQLIFNPESNFEAIDRENTDKCIIWLKGWIENEIHTNDVSLSKALLTVGELLSWFGVEASIAFIPEANVRIRASQAESDARKALNNKLYEDILDLIPNLDVDSISSLMMQFRENFRQAFAELEAHYSKDPRLT